VDTEASFLEILLSGRICGALPVGLVYLGAWFVTIQELGFGIVVGVTSLEYSVIFIHL